jgi:tRNA(fMet)-specific endonuclease VapC
MSLYVLDTDIASLYQHGHAGVVQHIIAHPLSDLTITVITIEEQLSGWYTALRRIKQRDQLARTYLRLAMIIPFLARFPILSYTVPAILRFEHFHTLKLNIRTIDLRIAAIALESNGIVVTRNLRDFRRVPGLVVQDWTV